MGQTLREQLQELWPTKQETKPKRQSTPNPDGEKGDDTLTTKELIRLFAKIWPRAFFSGQSSRVIPLSDDALCKARRLAIDKLSDVASRRDIDAALNTYTGSRAYKAALRTHGETRFKLDGKTQPRRASGSLAAAARARVDSMVSDKRLAVSGQGRPEVRLISKRGRRIDLDRQCAACGALISPTWRYAESNLGPVHLCGGCKPRVMEQSFGKVDAMVRSVSAGAFESNRNKH